MATNDIRPLRSPEGGYVKIRPYALAPGQTFNVGEPVCLVAGQLTLAANNPNYTSAEFIGIAGEPAEGLATRGDGVRNTEDDPRTVYLAGPQTEFFTENFSVNVTGPAFGSPVTQALVGVLVAIVVNAAGEWGISDGTGVGAANFIAEITQVFDNHRIPVKGTTVGSSVAFQILAQPAEDS